MEKEGEEGVMMVLNYLLTPLGEFARLVAFSISRSTRRLS